MDGYSATVFAYGHTGSGKTHTMSGTPSDPGIIPRAVEQIFQSINTLTSAQGMDNEVVFLVKISYVELYNNTFRNLLSGLEGTTPVSPAAKFKRDRSDKIEVRENPSTGTFLFGPPNLHHTITTPTQAHCLIQHGSKSRSTGSTLCNEQSSRSHSILTIHVESQLSARGITQKELRMGKLHLVDLAGSERVSMSGATGQTLTETQNINSSLSALGNVLSALSKNATRKNGNNEIPPYRDSKLTHLLKDSLGGNSKTLMMTTLRGGDDFYQHTVLSLMYAARAKKIKNTTSVNRDVSSSQSELHQISSDIEGLKRRLVERAREFEELSKTGGRSKEENKILKDKVRIDKEGRGGLLHR